MSTSNTPLATIETQPKNKSYKNAIIGVLAVALVSTGGFLAYDRSNNTAKISQQEAQIATVTTEKSNLQSSFDASLARLDSMGTVTNGLNTELTAKNAEIAKAKEEIRSILNKKNATAAELSRAKNMIASLNGKISSMEQEIAKLTEDNKLLGEEKLALTADKEKLTQDLTTTTGIKQELEKKVDIASTLNASNIIITPINVKHNGKEKVSTTAKRVDKMVVSFDVANRIIQPGSTDLYVLVIGPDGQPITTGPATGLFTTREEGDKTYTAKVPVDLETAKTKNVAFSFAPGTNFQKGNYKIQIYQNGFLIGQGTKELKKGGLFS
jgi:peptidoglycan hydrolase CwlO-like protein